MILVRGELRDTMPSLDELIRDMIFEELCREANPHFALSFMELGGDYEFGTWCMGGEL